MEYKKITENDLVGKGVVGQPDTPALSALEMQNKVEEVVRDVVIPRFNELVEALTENGQPVQSSDVMQMRIGESGDLQISADGVQWLNVADKALEGKADKDNSYTKDQMYTKEETDAKLDKKAEADKVYTKEETDKAIGDKLTEVGAGDMQKAVYDTDGDGMVDNAKKLDGHEADYFMPKSGGTFTGMVTLKGDPKANLHAATKQYVDNHNKLVTLWTNASPTSSFNEQTISVNLSAYKYVAIQSRPTGGDEGGGFDFIPVGKAGALSSMRKNVGAIYNRYAKVTTTGVEFGNGTFIGGTTGSDNAGWCIPLYIYGIK